MAGAPENIGKYQIRLQIGRGAMGVVYEAWDTQIERRVALKTLRTDQIDASQLPGLLARFKREAQAVGRLSHPHIVTIHDYGVEAGTPYLVMEYIKGRELAHDLQRRARFPLEDVVRIMTQLLGALAHAHEQGVVHRDLKPANMFLLDDGSLKVVDFGIARVDDSEYTVLTSDGAVLGTPAYMSPEQVDSLPVDHRSDLFSAGIILYELLVGERPFTGESVDTVKQKVRSQEPLRPSEANPTLSGAWDRVVARALAKKPSARYESARQFAEAIKAAHQAERAQAEETRLKAAEAGEHALRAAEERSREEARRREDFARREIERKEREEAEARRTAAVRKATQQPKPATPPPPPPPAANTSSSRTPILVAVLLAAAAAVGGYLYLRQSAEVEAAKAEAARIAAETRAKDESDRRAKAEALAREEAEKRSRLEAEAKRQAEQAEKARAEEEARKALALKKEEEEKKKAELAARKEAEAKARAEAEAKKQAELAKAEAEKKARAEEAAKAEAAKKAEEAKLAARRPGRVFQDCPDCPRMVVIPAGEFTMGSPASEAGRDADEGPQHRVTIAKPFALGRNEVTVTEFRRFVEEAGYRTDAERNKEWQGCRAWDVSDGKWEWRAGRDWRNPGFSQSGSGPAVCLSWNDARAYTEWLAKKTGQRYRLPSEAEWEYAARAGSTASRPWGDDPDLACQFANVADQTTHEGNSWSQKHNCNDGHWFPAPVGTFKPNRFGLFDMLGNVWEWTEDCWNAGYGGAPADGSARLTGNCSQRVGRGGSWGDFPRLVRSALRGWDSSGDRNYVDGFRLARTLE